MLEYTARQKSKFGVMSLAQINTIIFVFVSLCVFTNCQSNPNIRITDKHIYNGNKAAQLGQFEVAKKEYLTALRHDPSSLPGRRNLGITLGRLGDYNNSIRVLQSVYSSFSQDEEFLYFLGESYRGLKNYPTAQKYYYLAKQQSPNDDRVIKSIAWTYLSQNKPWLAKKEILNYYTNHKYDVQAMLIMSKAYYQLKEYQSSIQVLSIFEVSEYKLKSANEALANTEKILLLEVLADDYFALRQYQKAGRMYSLILQERPLFPRILLKSALCDIKLKNPTEAQRKLKKAETTDPNNLHIAEVKSLLNKYE